MVKQSISKILKDVFAGVDVNVIVEAQCEDTAGDREVAHAKLVAALEVIEAKLKESDPEKNDD